MAYTLDYAVVLGPGQTGIASSLRAQLVDTAAADVGSAVTTGFVEIGTSGTYLWHYAAFPDGHRGGVKFYNVSAATIFLAFAAINPQEAEFSDQKVSTVLDRAMVELGAPPAVTGSVLQAIEWLFALAKNKRTTTATTETVLKDDSATGLGTATVADDGTTFSRTKWA